jgi:hypothetical protein
VIEDEVGLGAIDELLRVLKNCPKWKPAMEDGIPVRFKYTLPLVINQ